MRNVRKVPEWAAILGLVIFMTPGALGAGQQPSAAADKPAAAAAAAEKPAEKPEEPPIVTHHELHAGGRTLRYTATVGRLPIKSDKGDVEASIFFMAYTLEGVTDVAHRPLMFSFNGGPGSSSVWLHLGAIGPRRVKMLDDGGMPAPPFELVDNEQTWLDQTDLVFIDPVGTGYSRASEARARVEVLEPGWRHPVGGRVHPPVSDARAPLGVAAVPRGGELRHDSRRGPRRQSHRSRRRLQRHRPGVVDPQFPDGGVHQGQRPAVRALSSDLHGHGLVSQEARPRSAGGSPVDAEARPKPSRSARTRRRWRREISCRPPIAAAIATEVSRFTGLSAEYVALSNLRIEIQRFCKELLRSDRRTVGRLDSRFTGIDGDGAAGEPEYDPSMAAIRPPYTATFQHYVATELGYTSDEPYHILGGGFTQWDWNRDNGFVDTSEALRRAFAHNPHMRLFVASGYYDLATPYFATAYTLSHLGLDPALARTREHGERYQAGHMMYIDVQRTRAAAARRRRVPRPGARDEHRPGRRPTRPPQGAVMPTSDDVMQLAEACAARVSLPRRVRRYPSFAEVEEQCADEYEDLLVLHPRGRGLRARRSRAPGRARPHDPGGAARAPAGAGRRARRQPGRAGLAAAGRRVSPRRRRSACGWRS